ncbi:hypothetical protein QTP88_022885 [Uroleucon formosanum]
MDNWISVMLHEGRGGCWLFSSTDRNIKLNNNGVRTTVYEITINLYLDDIRRDRRLGYRVGMVMIGGSSFGILRFIGIEN